MFRPKSAIAKGGGSKSAGRSSDRKTLSENNYTILGKTFDGVDVLKPKMKATHVKPADTRRVFKEILGRDGIDQIVRASLAAADKA